MKPDNKTQDGANKISRRDFGRLLGAASVAATFPSFSSSSRAIASTHNSGGIALNVSTSSYESKLRALLEVGTNPFHHREAWSLEYARISLMMEDALRSMSYYVTRPLLEVPFRGQTFNVVADLAPDDPHEPSSMLSYTLVAHLDSIAENIQGANDNGSGVAAVLELAEGISYLVGRRHHVRIVLCGAEEKGLEGSTAYVNSAYGGAPFALPGGVPVASQRIINLDTIGTSPESGTIPALNLEFSSAVNGSGSISDDLLNYELPAQFNVARYDIGSAIFSGSQKASDHLAFLNVGVPAISITSDAADPNMHSDNDTFDNVDLNSAFTAVAWVDRYLYDKLLFS